MPASTRMGPVWRIMLVGTFVALVDSRAAVGHAASNQPPPCPVNPPCIRYRAEARPGNGYDHLVHVSNACDAVAECSVSTDVNPDAKNVVIDPGTEQTVVTAKNARTPDFTATVSCSLRC